MARFGSISTFHSSEGDWKSYMERLNQYLAANDITEPDKKRAILLSSVGAATCKLNDSLQDMLRDIKTDKRDN